VPTAVAQDTVSFSLFQLLRCHLIEIASYQASNVEKALKELKSEGFDVEGKFLMGCHPCTVYCKV
jgi:hypothetical protein